MEYFVEQAPTYTECLNKIHTKYGKSVTILYHKTIRMGGLFGFFTKEGVELTGVVTNVGPRNMTSLNIPEAALSRKASDFEEERKKVLAVVPTQTQKDPTLQQVLNEVRTLKERIDAGTINTVPAEHTTIKRVDELLILNDFSPGFRQTIQERIKKECSIDMLNDYNAVQDSVLEWIGESIRIYKEEKFQQRPRIIALIGPTGVGKTTTIAKLAAIYGIGNSGRRPINVRMITIDAFRIGARAQLEAYSKIMDLPVSFADDYDDLKKTIALYSEETDMLLIDTIGKSPRDSAKLGEMKQILDACGTSSEIHLAIAATTKADTITEIMQQFEPFAYRSVVVTKLDETPRIGNIISALAERQKSISYITDGQKVPNNIQNASIVRFLINIEGFHVNRAKIEARFPSNPSDQIQWR
ncbi:MAG: AAA family ATPase [Treponema sp.]|jgi:flagellar biosynthesis protein FlhF|nr:AAA family ATPase [Treponema sp.]